MTSDVTITGNLTVQGSSTYLTVASTNTYVNDPLIILNNAFSGTNTYDIGLLFNRGNQTSIALVWNEANDEFRFHYTTDDGNSYGAIDNSGYGNVRLGNLAVAYDASLRNLTSSGNVDMAAGTVSGDFAINGGDLTTSASTFNLLNATATTLNFAGAATTLTVGATSGTLSLRNANVWLPNATTLDGAQTTVSLFNNAATIDAFKNATDIEFGAAGTAGTLTLNNDVVVGSSTTQDVFNTTATTVNAFGAATTLTVGATSGTLNLRNANIWLPNATTLDSAQASIDLLAIPTTANAFNSATTLTLAATSGTTNVRNNLDVDLSLNARDIQSTVIGNVTPSAATFTTLTSQGTTQLSLTSATAINTTPIGNATPSSATFTTLTSQGTTQLSLTSATAINNTPIGNATASSGAFTTLTASGVTEVTDTTDATSVGTGAFRVAGGTSVSGNLYVGGNINITGSSYVLTSNAGVFYGDANGFGALYAGVTGYTQLPATVVQTTGSFNGYVQNNFQNLSTGAKASTDWVATAGNGADYDHYINMGITTSGWDGTQDNSLTNSLGDNDGYIYVQGNVSTGQGGNLVVGASTPGTKKVSVIVGGNTASNITAVFSNPETVSSSKTTGALTVAGGVGITGNVNANNLNTGNVVISSDNPSTSTATGALTVAGGAGIGGNLWVGANLVVGGDLTVQGNVVSLNTSTLDVEDLNITIAKGAASSAAADGAGITVDGASATILYTHATTSWDFNKTISGIDATFSGTLAVTGATTLTDDLAVNGGDITTSASTFNLLNTNATTLNFAGAATALNLGATSGTTTVKNNLDVDLSLNARDLQSTVIGNVTPAEATFTTLTSQGTTQLSLTSATAINTTPIGNATPSTGVFTTLTGDDVYVTTSANLSPTGTVTVNPGTLGAIDNVAIGANTPSTAEFTTLETSSTTTLSLTTATAINNTPIGNATPSTGAFTTLTTTSTANVGALTAASINGTVIGNVDPVSATFTTLTSQGTTTLGAVSAASINSTVIGNTTPASGDFTRLAASGIVYANSTATSTSYNNGALVVAGGVGVDGNIHVPDGKYISVGAELVGTKSNNSVGEFISNANVASVFAVRNLSSGPSASSNFVSVADLNGPGFEHYFAVGIANSQFDEGTLPKAYDAYAFCEGGNTIISAQTMGKEVVLNAGSPFANAVVARASSITNGFNVVRTTQATSPTTGALTVAGGTGIAGNIWVANGAVINDSQTSDNFIVKGKLASSLIVADSNNGAVIIGGSNASPQLGATLKVNSTDSFMVPVGSTSERPGNSGNVDVQGMLRFNTSTSTLEFYTGTSWTAAGSDTTFTIITSETFTGNGLANTYVLSSNTTTNGTVVSINGILQIPTLAYSISGTTLQFTENPADGDIIDVRTLATTQTVGDVTSPNGLNTFTPDNSNGAAIYSGTTTSDQAIRATAKPDGTWAYVNGTKTTYDQTATSVASASSPVVVDSFVASDYTTAKYVVQIKQSSGNVQVMEALLAHDGANAYITTYGIVDTNGEMGTLSANIVSSNVRLYYTSSTLTNSNVKVYTTYIV